MSLQKLMMKPWQVTLESILQVLMWIANALGDVVMFVLFSAWHDTGPLVMLLVLGSWHFILNGVVVRHQWRNMHKFCLIILLVTQLAPLYMLCRRALRSLSPYCAKDERTKSRKALIAQYSLCVEAWSSTQQNTLTDINDLQKGSCVPSGLITENQSTSTVADAEDSNINDSAFDQFFNAGEVETRQNIPIGLTKFAENTYNIELNFNPSESMYTGEPNIFKYLMNVLRLLYVDEKKLSYHIITNTQNVILYITKSDRHIRNLPSPIQNENSTTICNDIHYAYNLTKSLGYEVYAYTKRSLEESTFVVQADLSKYLWCLLWPSAIIKLFVMFDVIPLGTFGEKYHLLLVISPAFSAISWLLTQRTVTEPWRNTAILILLRITMTIPRAILVVGVGLRSILLGAVCFISVKIVGFTALSTQIIYSKKWKNIELYGDEIDRYSFNPNLVPAIQICESVVYMIWGIWFYVATPLSELKTRENNEKYPLVCLLTIMLGHVLGLTWLYFARSLLKQPLKNPASILRQIQDLEYIKT